MSNVVKWTDVVKKFGGPVKASEAVKAGKAEKVEGGYIIK